jgi:hypothetical protein
MAQPPGISPFDPPPPAPEVSPAARRLGIVVLVGAVIGLLGMVTQYPALSSIVQAKVHFVQVMEEARTEVRNEDLPFETKSQMDRVYEESSARALDQFRFFVVLLAGWFFALITLLPVGSALYSQRRRARWLGVAWSVAVLGFTGVAALLWWTKIFDPLRAGMEAAQRLLSPKDRALYGWPIEVYGRTMLAAFIGATVPAIALLVALLTPPLRRAYSSQSPTRRGQTEHA